MWRAAVWAVALGMSLFLGAHVALWRSEPSMRPRVGRLGLLAALGLVMSSGSVVARGGNLELWCSVLWIELFLMIAYFGVYALLARSVSLTLLARLRASPVPLDVLVQEYDTSAQFEDRLRVMDASGYVRLSDQAVSLTAKGAALARGAKAVSGAICATLEG